MKADFIILDTNPFDAFFSKNDKKYSARKPKVVATYMEGRCVFGCEDEERRDDSLMKDEL